MALRSVRVWLLGAWLAAGCFGPGDNSADGSTPALGGDSLVGDWVHCVDTACTEMNDDGTRFTDDGLVIELDFNEGPVRDGPVCVVVGEVFGTYTLVDDLVTLDNEGEFRVELRGDQATFLEVGGSERADLLRVQSQSMASCPSDDPPPRASGP